MSEFELMETRQIVPADEMNRAGLVAAACREIVLRTTQSIKGKQYVKIEGWQAIACAHGCTLSANEVRPEETGYSARAEVRRIDTGQVIATAEGFVGNDETMWRNRPEFARRAMAQTRAMSRAGRSAFAHVVVLMDAGLSTTPAEEMDFLEAETVPEPAPKPAKVEMTIEERRDMCGKAWVKAGGTVEALETHFGKPVSEFDEADLDFASHTFAKAKAAKSNPDEALKGAATK